MFDLIFGGKRKLELIRELLEQRMREDGFDDMNSRLHIKELGKLQLLGTPEGAIVTIVETVMKSQRQGALLASILSAIENHRKTLGSDPHEFAEIINGEMGSCLAWCIQQPSLTQRSSGAAQKARSPLSFALGYSTIQECGDGATVLFSSHFLETK